MFDDAVLEDSELLERRDPSRLLWSLAGAGAQVRRGMSVAEEFGVDRLRGDPPRSLLVATDAPSVTAARLIPALAGDACAALAFDGVDLPRWAGPADALLVGCADGRHPRLAGLVAQAAQRGLALAVAAPAGSPVAAAAGRAPVHELVPDLHPHAVLWAVLTPLLQALDALGVAAVPDALLERVADALDETAGTCRPTGDVFTNPAKSLAIRLAECRAVVAGAGALAGVAARAVADAVQLSAGLPAVAVRLPDEVARAGALLRGPNGLAADPDDFFRDRVEDPAGTRACLIVIGDDGTATDPALGPRSDARVQLEEVAGRRAADALRELAERFNAPVTGVDVPAGPPLARFAAAVSFGEFSAAYLGLGHGLDPGAPRPAELGH